MTENILDTASIDFEPKRAPKSAPRLEEPVRGGLEGIDQLLRRPVWFVQAAAQHTAADQVVRALLLAVLLGAGLFGASMGLFRPGPQILSSAIKLPLVLLLTAAISAPAYTAARWAFGASADMRQDILLFLSTLSLTSLVLAALAPVVLLGVLSGFSYHATILAVVACCGAAGLVGLLAFARAASRQPGPSKRAALLAALIFAVVGTQMAWTLRPFVARPRAPFEVLRSMEGGFIEAVGTSARSAQGDYSRQQAPLPESE